MTILNQKATVDYDVIDTISQSEVETHLDESPFIEEIARALNN